MNRTLEVLFSAGTVIDEMLQDPIKYSKVETQVKYSICTKRHIKNIYYDILPAELKASVGLLYLTVISHGNHNNVKHLWSINGSKYAITSYFLINITTYAFILEIQLKTNYLYINKMNVILLPSPKLMECYV